MSKNQQIIDSAIEQEYEYGFVTDIDQDTLAPGLNEEVINSFHPRKVSLSGFWIGGSKHLINGLKWMSQIGLN